MMTSQQPTRACAADLNRSARRAAPTLERAPSSAVVDANRADRPDHAADAPHGTSTGLPSCTIHERVHTGGTLPYVAGIAKI